MVQEPQILAVGKEVMEQDTSGLLDGVDDAFRRVGPFEKKL